MTSSGALSPEREAGTAPRSPVRDWLRMSVGLAAIGFSVLYLGSDVLEVGQGHFSRFRLALTYAGEAVIPLFVLGLYAVQRPRVGRLGLFGAAAYAYSYVFFTSTVVYALVARIPDYAGVTSAFGGWMVVHGVIMVVGGVTFGVAVARARVFPEWTGICLAVGRRARCGRVGAAYRRPGDRRGLSRGRLRRHGSGPDPGFLACAPPSLTDRAAPPPARSPRAGGW